MNRKGSVLLHVLVTSALVALIGASVLRLSMTRSLMAAHAINSNSVERQDESAMNMVFGYWNSVNAVCANPGAANGYTCAGGGGANKCGCTCTPAGLTPATYPTITTCALAGGCNAAPPCSVTVVQAVDPIGSTIY